MNTKMMLAFAVVVSMAGNQAFAGDNRFEPTKDQNKIASAIGKIIGAALANEISKPEPGDEFAETFAKALLKAGRDELIESAIGDVYPKLDKYERRSIRTVISLACEGKLSLENLKAEEAKQKIIDALRSQDKNLGDAASVADFIYNVQKSRRK